MTEGLEDRNRTGTVDWLEVGLIAVEVGVMEGGVMGRVELYSPSARYSMYKWLRNAVGLALFLIDIKNKKMQLLCETLFKKVSTLIG